MTVSPTIIAFIGFLIGFTLIGLSSLNKSRGTRHDYYLADSSVKPWLVSSRNPMHEQ